MNLCCRASVSPLVPELAIGILVIGQFVSDGATLGKPYPQTWRRRIEEEGAEVMASLVGETLELSLSPAISAFAHHYGKRLTAGVYFEIAAKYAEKVDGTIIQRANVVGCRTSENETSGLLLARYPAEPLLWEKCCAGFRAVLLGDAGGEDAAG